MLKVFIYDPTRKPQTTTLAAWMTSTLSWQSLESASAWTAGLNMVSGWRVCPTKKRRNGQFVEILDRTFSTKQHVHTKAVRAQWLPNLTIPAGTTRPVQRVQQRACQANSLSDTNTWTILVRKPFTPYTRKLLTTQYLHLRRVLRTSIPTLINS